ncbi:MAG: DUF3990 domain-containing protein [Bacteroidales bacterium]|nr:DUF3990 domain-containing protein [Bacteroidales bacterium]
MIELFHGSNVKIDEIDLSFGKRGKDFGRGFYLSDNKMQAQKMAELVTSREEYGEPTISTFLFDEGCIKNGALNVRIFENYSIEWAEFVVRNRTNNSKSSAHDYDIVWGPIANDTVGVQIRRYILNYIDINRLIEELKYIRPTFQYFFGTEESLKYLKRVR